MVDFLALDDGRDEAEMAARAEVQREFEADTRRHRHAPPSFLAWEISRIIQHLREQDLATVDCWTV
jgi:hypothetical protein